MTDGAKISGRYTLLYSIAGGAQGDVWAALDERLNMRVAIKFYMKGLGITGSKELEIRRRALPIWQSLENPHIVALLDHDQDFRGLDAINSKEFDGFLVMRFAQVSLLEEIREPKGEHAVGRLLDWMYQMMLGLHGAHSVGIIHRDLKPGNILLSKQAGMGLVAMLTDFDLASMADVLEPLVDDMFCSYEVYGDEDILIRVWVNEKLGRPTEDRVSRICRITSGNFDRLEVHTYEYLWCEDRNRSDRRTMTSRNVRRFVKSVAKDPNWTEKTPDDDGLVVGHIPRSDSQSVKAFTQVTCHKKALDERCYTRLKMIVRQVLQQEGRREEEIRTSDNVSRATLYYGTLTMAEELRSNDSVMPCVLIKFNAKNFYAVRAIPYALHGDPELSIMGLRTNTYLVTSPADMESDDGPFLLDI